MNDGQMIYIRGTNCYNCKYINRQKETPIDQDQVNECGGLDPINPIDMLKAQKADLISLPGCKEDQPTERMCMNPNINMNVTRRMCCNYWNNDLVKRQWEKPDGSI